MAADSDLPQVPALPDLGRRPYLPLGHPEWVSALTMQSWTRTNAHLDVAPPAASAAHAPAPGLPPLPWAGHPTHPSHPGCSAWVSSQGPRVLRGRTSRVVASPGRIPQRSALVPEWPLVLGQGRCRLKDQAPPIHLPAYVTAQRWGGQGTGVPAANSRTPVHLNSRPSLLDNLLMVVEVGAGGHGGMGGGGLPPAVLSSFPSAPQALHPWPRGQSASSSLCQPTSVLGSPLPPSACPSYSHCSRDCSLLGGSCGQGQEAVPTSGS